MKRKPRKIFLKILLILAIIFLVAIGGIVIWYHFDTKLAKPDVNVSLVNQMHRDSIDTGNYTLGKNWLKKNKYGLWEMYVEGAPFERGVAIGKLTKNLLYTQEKVFVDRIREMVPSENYLKFLKYFVKFFDRDIEEYVLPEYQQEIYGISFSASHDFNFIGSNYERLLNYHAAHDIGHALQNLMLVGCTSFSANMGYNDSSLIIGRNFDFYVNDAFAENKIICFENPDHGYKFTYITWAGMIGVVSGMNDKGLTVTLNAGRSDIPFKAATPISLLAREILQYASNIDEAKAIAQKRKTFVSESLLIGSKEDNKAVILEKSPTKFGVYEVSKNYLVCANHFQSETFATDKNNREQILESASSYRENRALELIGQKDTINYLYAASILRDRNGWDGVSIGIGNEKAMAQMISHHSIIFLPGKSTLWISTAPYQLGSYLAYHINQVFANPVFYKSIPLYDSTLTIPPDPFLYSDAFANFKVYKTNREKILKATKLGARLSMDFIKDFTLSNPDYYQGYVLAGDYFLSIGDKKRALQFYKFSLKKVFEKSPQRTEVEEKIRDLSGK
jgi:predicted choloylglycine hydrolase